MSDEKMTVEQALAFIGALRTDRTTILRWSDSARDKLESAFQTLTAALADLKAENERLTRAVQGRDDEIEIYKGLVHKVKAERDALRADAGYLRWRLEEIMPLFEEARDALPAITENSRMLRGISKTLADRMDAAGTRTRAEYDAAREGSGK